MKKISKRLFMISFCAILLSGCGKTDASPTETVKENSVQEKQKITTVQKQKPQAIIPEKDKVNINDMNETALANLPGISIIQAKKIIDRINFKGDFHTLEEFYSEMKIKSHFQKKLNNLIYAKPTEKKYQTDSDDRIIDL